MLTKLERKDCLKRYPNFPQRHYNGILDEEEYFYPKVFSVNSFKVKAKDKDELAKSLVLQTTKLINSISYSKIIFLGDTEKSWISHLLIERDNYEPLNQAKQYFAVNNIDNNFNGGIQVEVCDLSEFLKHFYVLTSCDASLPYFHFIDSDQNIVGYIHYTTEVRIDALNQRTEKLLKNAVEKTKFIKVRFNAK